MNEHTKGPWTIETPCGFPYSGLYVVPVVRKDFPYYIAQIRQLREREESEANACLIAAAPDLLAACEGLMRAWVTPKSRSMHQLKKDMDEAYQKAEATIAKTKKEG